LWPEARGLAVDVDSEATDCSRENFELNRVSRVSTLVGTLDEVPAGESFDLVLANIQRDVLELIAAAVLPRVAPRGRLVLSGLLLGDAEPVARCYEAAGFRVLARSEEGEWAGLVLARAQDAPGV
jgi:ribosomal protein L11 methyltransferase